MKDLKEYLARLLTKEERLGLRPSGIMESIEKMDSSDMTTQEYLDAIKAEYKRRGLKEPNIELINPTDEELNTYTVMFVPQRPRPKLVQRGGGSESDE